MTRVFTFLPAVAVWLAVTGPRRADTDPSAEFDRLFGQVIRKVRATADHRDDLEAAGMMLKVARQTPENVALRALLCENAFDLAVRYTSGHALAAEAVKLGREIAPQRDAQWQERLLDLYRAAMAKARGAEKRTLTRKFAKQLVIVGDRKLEAGDSRRAEALYRQALALATSQRMALRTAILEKIRRTRDLRQIYLRRDMLAGRLKKNPADQSSREGLIRLYVVDLDQPATAGDLLTDDVDERIRTYVPLAAKPVEEIPTAVCYELAQWYQSLSAKAAKGGQIHVLGRALAYYKRFLKAESGEDLLRLKAGIEVKRIEKELSRLTGKPLGLPIPGAVVALTFEKDTFFQQDGRTMVRDQSGRNNHGLVVGCTSTTGVAGAGMLFDGKDDYVSLGNPKDLQITGSMTIAMWLAPSSLGSRRNPFAKSYGSEGTMTLESRGTIHVFWGTAGSDTYPYQGFLMSKPLVAGKWTHIVFVRDLKAMKLTWYRNGAAVNTAAARYRAASASKVAAYLGKGYVNPYSGKMDEVVIFARALSAKGVALLYTRGRKGEPLR